MSFDTLDEWQKNIAEKTLAQCRRQYGPNGLKIEQPIDKSIAWRPTFFLKPGGGFVILAIEVNDLLYPEILKVAAYDISHYDYPIAIYQACSLDAYQHDKNHERVNLLRNHGFGIITVASDDTVSILHSAVPLTQHISDTLLSAEISHLNASLKVRFKSAYATYLTNIGQGLQEAGQHVEGLVSSFAKQTVSAGVLPKTTLKKPLAGQIDDLYHHFNDHRAALGDARAFINEFRNVASHAPKSAKQANAKMRNCKNGFLDAINVSRKLSGVMNTLGYRIKIYTT